MIYACDIHLLVGLQDLIRSRICILEQAIRSSEGYGEDFNLDVVFNRMPIKFRSINNL